MKNPVSLFLASIVAAWISASAQIDPNLSSLAEQSRVDALRFGKSIAPLTACFAGTIQCTATVTGRVSVDSCVTSDFVYGVGYLFNGTVGQRITLFASSPSFRMWVVLGDGRSGNTTIYAQSQAPANGVAAQISSFSLPYTGPYLILLSPLVPFTFGDYSLTITCTSAPPAGCAASSTQLCLQANRFAVSVTFKDHSSPPQSGTGQAVSLTSDSGYFWFFGSSNAELVVKVLDGRALGGYWWVFYGSLTDVEFTMTVRDISTGKVKTYFNPSGKMASVGDTSAF